jgi:hypothetical protein
VVDWDHGIGLATDVSECRKGGDMSVTGGVVAALIVAVLVAGVIVVARSRRASRTASGELLFPNTDPLPLGGHVVVRFTAVGPVPATGPPVRAVLVCHELVPGAGGAEPTLTVASSVDCPVQMLTHEPVGEAEIWVDIPLSASPSMFFADHRVDWTLTVHAASTTVHCAVQVAPMVARAVVQAEANS